ncbi:MAG: protein kinase [Polyangiaceae bacterium]|nr:protein kinase [Polyangiaceae bacterium]
MALGPDPLHLLGKTLAGHFRVDEYVGEEVFGVVYRGTQVGANSPVALKCLRLDETLDSAGAESFLKLFREENKTFAKFTKTDDGFGRGVGSGMTATEGRYVLYLVLELYKGRSLRTERERKRSYYPKEIASLLGPAGHALLRAHGNDLPHGGLSTATIFLLEPVGVKILDLGLGALVERAAAALSFPALSMRTGFDAPERATAKEVETLLRCDIYSFAKVVLELLVGRDMSKVPPHHDQDVLAELALPAAVRAVVSRGLSSIPDMRHPTLYEFWEQFCEAAEQGSLPSEKLLRARPAVDLDDATPTGEIAGRARNASSGRLPTAAVVPPAAFESGDVLPSVIVERSPQESTEINRRHAPTTRLERIDGLIDRTEPVLRPTLPPSRGRAKFWRVAVLSFGAVLMLAVAFLYLQPNGLGIPFLERLFFRR